MIEIDKNVPIPEGAGKKRIYPWAEMQVGDSFLMPKGIMQVATRAGAAGRRYKMKFTTRTTPEGVRVWRIA